MKKIFFIIIFSLIIITLFNQNSNPSVPSITQEQDPHIKINLQDKISKNQDSRSFGNTDKLLSESNHDKNNNKIHDSLEREAIRKQSVFIHFDHFPVPGELPVFSSFQDYNCCFPPYLQDESVGKGVPVQ